MIKIILIKFQLFSQISYLSIRNNQYHLRLYFSLINYSKTIIPLMLKIYLLLVISFFFLSNAFLEVYIPECARRIIPSNINYTLSNFGYIPYGESSVGQLFVPQGQNNSELCNIENQPQLKSQTSKQYMLVKRGTCKFTQKVLNAQKLGADYVIIYDNMTSDRPRIIMKNDGHGHLITIPSAFISNSDGVSILRAMSECSQNIILKQVFDVFQKDIVDLQLWLNLNKRESYVLLKDFYKYDYFNVIEEYVNTSVKFKVEYGCSVGYCKEVDCIGSEQNKYCLPIDRVYGKNFASGSELLKESLRMYLLFDLLPQNKNKLWFEYMDKFDSNLCLELPDVEACSYETMKETGVSNDLIEAIKKNVTETLNILKSEKYNENNIFYWVTNEADQNNILFYPEAIINGKNFYGLFKAPEVFEMICNSLTAQPKQCYSFIKNKTAPQSLDKTEDLWLTVLFIVLLMTLGFLVALFVYTRLIKKQVNQQMSMQVNKMVQNYVSLTEQKSGSIIGKSQI